MHAEFPFQHGSLEDYAMAHFASRTYPPQLFGVHDEFVFPSDLASLTNSSSSPAQMELCSWDTMPSPAPEQEGPLICTNPTPRALKAKRRPTNKCECGGKGSCENPLCAKSVGCHSCPVCGIEFSRKNSMRRHVLTHINLRPYECRDCNKSFYRSDIYKRHLVSKRCRRNTSQAQILALCQHSNLGLESPVL
ncbi:hypothetical protein DSO57_1015079 [Entomophthora muscae]|uniref:Uncharacterized protein n=1 Tax=Entomophthora muscae TaxID=34485 RepID=A0ACC2T578_9FUNG|nr:hypothetical protein DSO57_1015079 [Entomophthora muscae]